MNAREDRKVGLNEEWHSRALFIQPCSGPINGGRSGRRERATVNGLPECDYGRGVGVGSSFSSMA